jgi:hypothetical protein
MKNEIIELFMEMHQYLDAFNQNLLEYQSGKSDFLDYTAVQKTFDLNEKLAQYNWGDDTTKWKLYEKVARLMAQEKYEQITNLKVLIDKIEELELLPSNI